MHVSPMQEQEVQTNKSFKHDNINERTVWVIETSIFETSLII